MLGVAVAALTHADACCGVWGLGGLGDLVVNGRGVREAGDAGVTLLQVLGGTDRPCPAWACCTWCACWPGAAGGGSGDGLSVACAFGFFQHAAKKVDAQPDSQACGDDAARDGPDLERDLALDVVNVCALVPGLGDPVARLVLLAEGFLGVAPGVLLGFAFDALGVGLHPVEFVGDGVF